MCFLAPLISTQRRNTPPVLYVVVLPIDVVSGTLDSLPHDLVVSMMSAASLMSLFPHKILPILQNIWDLLLSFSSS